MDKIATPPATFSIEPKYEVVFEVLQCLEARTYELYVFLHTFYTKPKFKEHMTTNNGNVPR